ncbi:MAG: ArsI/CadI family heavy metal resistance metalloenzyme [Acidimicrobiales bacterium]
MSRIQLAINVENIDAAIDFYSKLFDAEPAKVRPGYANFAVVDPPLKLVLIEDSHQAPGSLNHLGVEVETSTAVWAARDRLATAGMKTTTEEQISCCFALQDKVWVSGPGDERWEIYTVSGDTDAQNPQLSPSGLGPADAPVCSTSQPEPVTLES